MSELPTGTVTFLFTDLEGSTRLWDEHPAAMREAVARHDVLLRRAFESHRGHVFKTIGDAFCVAFEAAPDALQSRRAGPPAGRRGRRARPISGVASAVRSGRGLRRRAGRQGETVSERFRALLLSTDSGTASSPSASAMT